MTGLLRRLASRATGVPSPVRPVACLPFSAAPALVEDTTIASASDSAARPVALGPEPVALGPVPVIVPRPAGDEPAPFSTDAPGAGARRSPDPGPPAPGRRPNPSLPGLPESAGADHEASGTDDGSGDREAAVPAPASAEPDIAAVTLVRRPPRAVDRLDEVAETPARGGAELRAMTPHVGVAVRAVHPVIVPAPDDPEPLLPAPASFAISPAGGRSVAAPGETIPGPGRLFGSDRVEEITEVHVSIGRIEITAPPSAPLRPPRRSGTERKAMSLEDYLARKQSGRP